MKKTLILGATPNPTRYAYQAAIDLVANGHEIVPVGIKHGEVAGVAIQQDKTPAQDIDTITLYVGPQRQGEWYEFILATKPKRIIFNPGTENNELATMAQKEGIEVEIGCTLVMLSVGTY